MNETLDQLAIRYGTDKSSEKHFYTRYYAELFRDLRDREIVLLELGVKRGASLRMWKDYFRNGDIHGVDFMIKAKAAAGEIPVYVGNTTDEGFMKSVMEKIGKPVDIIIDDASHKSQTQIMSFKMLWPYVKPGGYYVVEDMFFSFHRKYLIRGILERDHATAARYFADQCEKMHMVVNNYDWRNGDIFSVTTFPKIIFIRKWPNEGN